jgi:hypothetical protein
MITKQQILEEIKRTAKQNNGVPLGRGTFEQETGIKPYDWGKFWAKFSDAQREAGFAPNSFNAAFNDEFIFEKHVALMRELGRFPTVGDLQVKRNSDPEFPSPKTMLKMGSKADVARKISEYATQKGYQDIAEFCSVVVKDLGPEKSRMDIDDEYDGDLAGEVYLFKSGRFYKIGKTNDTVRRGAEIRIQLPEKVELIHSIKTDDPSGVEAYWHKRFEPKRMNGEWFDLTPVEIRAFKRWRRI